MRMRRIEADLRTAKGNRKPDTIHNHIWGPPGSLRHP